MAPSGLEIAGIVLHAFPLAINTLEICRDAAKVVGSFLQIKLAYKKWRDDLEFHRLLFTKNLRQLLLPLVLDDNTIEELLLAPGGDGWTEEQTVRLFEERLGESYDLYMKYIHGMNQTIIEINRELAVDSDWARSILRDESQASNSKTRLKSFMTRQFHKFKLSSNETTRQRLFGELQRYNDKLERLLKASDDDIRLQRDRKPESQFDSLDPEICNVWRQAKNVFQALTSAWTCQCQQHGAKLLLQHRTTGKSGYEITFSGFLASEFESHKVKILEAEDTALKQSVSALDSVPIDQPSHRRSHWPRSRLWTSNKKGESNKISRTQLSVRLARVETSPSLPISNEIVNLCASLGTSEVSYYGYLIQEECRYHVLNISRLNIEAVRSVTLDQMLRGDVSPLLTRSQRYNLSLILASTFLQLLDSPWLSVLPKRSDIIFFSSHHEDARIIQLDQPYISHDFRPSNTLNSASSPDKMFSFTAALDHLGIMLLELCFGRIIEEQTWRKKKGFDILAAREWQCHVNEEAGGDYAEAVSWCLGGNRIAPLERWRQEMLRRVVQPLHRCREYLSNGGADI
ncbi:hypothetical protein ACQKWADRAFT_324459 [Trichoderma austrokoningii]